MNIKHTLLIISIAAALGSCKKSYLDDGGKSKAEVNMTTYDYLKSQALFSDLVHLIDRAGLKDMVNGDVTFFATTNYGVQDYLKAMKQRRSIELGDENITYTLDSIPMVNLDSLKTYIFDGKINRQQMTLDGKLYDSKFGHIDSVQYLIRLVRTYNSDYSPYVPYVDYVTYTKVYGTRDDKELDPDNIPKDKIDASVTCQTSGIITTTGIVHVLDGFHRLLFNNDVIQ